VRRKMRGGARDKEVLLPFFSFSHHADDAAEDEKRCSPSFLRSVSSRQITASC
jgi:hypothetical protein